MPSPASRSLAIIFVVIAAICARLGVWQLDRLHQRRAANVIALDQRSRPDVALEAVPVMEDSSLIDRHVVVTGRYDYAHEILIRGQALDGVPGVHLVTPLVPDDGGTAVLVERGFVPAPDALTLPPRDVPPERALVHISGLALAMAAGQGGEPVTHAGRTSWRRLDLGALRDTLPYPIRAIYIRRIAERAPGSGFPRALPLPSLDDGPHLSYALQWFGFAAVALVFAGIMWRRVPGSGPLTGGGLGRH